MLPLIALEIIIEPGTTVIKAIAEALRIAQTLNVRVYFTHNSTRLHVNPDSNIEEVKDFFYMLRAGEELLK